MLWYSILVLLHNIPSSELFGGTLKVWSEKVTWSVADWGISSRAFEFIRLICLTTPETFCVLLQGYAHGTWRNVRPRSPVTVRWQARSAFGGYGTDHQENKFPRSNSLIFCWFSHFFWKNLGLRSDIIGTVFYWCIRDLPRFIPSRDRAHVDETHRHLFGIP